MMDPSRLKTLRELALRGTMAAVSQALHLTPSAVSQQISQLENEVGVALIERVGRGVRLTAAGDVLVAHAEKIMATLEDARTAMAELSGTISGTIRIMAFPSVAAAVLPGVVSALARSCPDLKLICEDMEPRPAVGALRSWQCDLAFLDDLTLDPSKDLAQLDITTVLRDELVAVLAQDHPLARRETVPLSALADLPWAMDTRADTFSDVIFDLCDQAGFRPYIPVRYDSYDVIAPFVANGSAVCVLPSARVTRPLAPGIVTRPLQTPVWRTISIATRTGELRRPALARVAETVQAVCAQVTRQGAFHADAAGTGHTL